MFRKTVTTTILAVAATMVGAAPVLASVTGPNLPTPGVLGIVAAGIVGAIALARTRK